MSAPVPHPLTVLLNAVAAQGKGGDRLLGHMTPGDVVVPAEKRTPKVNAALEAILGKQLPRFTAGNTAILFNPQTGLPEFESDSSDSSGEGPGGGGPSGASGPGTGANGTGNGTGGVGGGGPDTSDGPTGNGVKSSTAAEEQSAVSNTASKTGLSGLANDISVGAQHAATSLAGMLGVSSATVGNVGKAALAGLFGGPVAGAMSLAGSTMGVPSMSDVGKAMVANGVDNGSNPGSGKGDPGASGGGNGSDALASLYSLPYWQYRPFG